MRIYKKTTNQPRNPQPSPFRAQPHEHTNCRLPQSKRRYRHLILIHPGNRIFIPVLRGGLYLILFQIFEKTKNIWLVFFTTSLMFFSTLRTSSKTSRKSSLACPFGRDAYYSIPRNSLILFSGMPKLKEVVP